VEESNKGHSSEEEKHAQSMDRRRLLKMMATTTGAAGASFLLPAKWTKPLFDVIILPAHAATSTDNPPIISNFTVRSLPPNPLKDSNFTVAFRIWRNDIEYSGNRKWRWLLREHRLWFQHQCLRSNAKHQPECQWPL